MSQQFYEHIVLITGRTRRLSPAAWNAMAHPTRLVRIDAKT